MIHCQKISACELLHCLVLYMGANNVASTLPLWKDLCKNLVILGADDDQTVRELFEPLLMQMMHYFSLIFLLFLCYRGNSGVQDLSARLLRELLLWLEKQTDRRQRDLAPVKLVDLFQEM